MNTAAVPSPEELGARAVDPASAQLVIFYDGGGAAEPHMLETGSIYCVGSEQPRDSDRLRISGVSGKPVEFIELRGRSIAPNQFQLAHNGLDWLVTRYGTTPVWLNNTELESIQSATIDSESVLKVPGATITMRLFKSTAARGSTAQDAEWRAIQDELHRRMLDEFRLRFGSNESERGKSTENLRSDPRFIGTLAELAEESVGSMTDGVLASAVSWALRKFLVAKVAGARRQIGSLQDVPPQFVAQQLSLYGERIAKEIGLSLERSQVNVDLEVINRDLRAHLQRGLVNIPRGDQISIAKAFICGNIWDFIFNFGPITDLIKLEVVTEIMVVRYDKIFLERAGNLEPYGYAFSSLDQLKVLVSRIAAEAQRELNASNAMIDFALKDGSRVNVIGEPLSINGPAITIRKHRGEIAWTLEQLAKAGSMSQPMSWFLQACVAARKNIVISGGTGTGKTTLLNALSAFVAPDERVVTIEDTAELIISHDHVVTLQARPANAEGRNAVTIRMLVKNALRMRPDRIIVGECRGGEAVDMLQALNTGHAGSMTTAHANSPADMLLRLEVMVLQGEPNLPSRAIRQQIASAIDIVIQIARVDGARRIVEIAEVIGYDKESSDLIVEPIFVYLPRRTKGGTGRYLFTGVAPSFVDEIHQHRPLREIEGSRRPVAMYEMFI